MFCCICENAKYGIESQTVNKKWSFKGVVDYGGNNVCVWLISAIIIRCLALKNGFNYYRKAVNKAKEGEIIKWKYFYYIKGGQLDTFSIVVLNIDKYAKGKCANGRKIVRGELGPVLKELAEFFCLHIIPPLD